VVGRGRVALVLGRLQGEDWGQFFPFASAG
jgi:hypothetical protein